MASERPTLTLETAEERELWVSEFARRLAGTGDPPGVGAKYAAALAWEAVEAARASGSEPRFTPDAWALERWDRWAMSLLGLSGHVEAHGRVKMREMIADRCAPAQSGPRCCVVCQEPERPDEPAFAPCSACGLDPVCSYCIDDHACAPGASEPRTPDIDPRLIYPGQGIELLADRRWHVDAEFDDCGNPKRVTATLAEVNPPGASEPTCPHCDASPCVDGERRIAAQVTLTVYQDGSQDSTYIADSRAEEAAAALRGIATMLESEASPPAEEPDTSTHIDRSRPGPEDTRMIYPGCATCGLDWATWTCTHAEPQADRLDVFLAKLRGALGVAEEPEHIYEAMGLDDSKAHKDGRGRAARTVRVQRGEEPDNSGLDALRAVVESDAEYREIRAEEAGPAMCDHDDVYPGEFCMDCHEVKPAEPLDAIRTAYYEGGEPIASLEQEHGREAVAEVLGFEHDDLAAEYHAQGNPPREVLDAVRANYPRAGAGGAPTGPGWWRFLAEPGWWVGVLAEMKDGDLLFKVPFTGEWRRAADYPDGWWGGPCLQGGADAAIVDPAIRQALGHHDERSRSEVVAAIIELVRRAANLDPLARAVESVVRGIEAHRWPVPPQVNPPAAPAELIEDWRDTLRAALDAAKGDA